MSISGQSVFDYNPAIPEVIPQIQRRFFSYPTGTYQQFVNSNDVIRFQFPKTKDFFDPWSLYFNGTINVPAPPLIPQQVVQGAGSFNHIFSSVVFYDPTGRELERINGYNKLMEVLETVSYDPRQMSGMAWQGFGGTVDTSWGYQCGPQPVPVTPMHSQQYTSGAEFYGKVIPCINFSGANALAINYFADGTSWGSVNQVGVQNQYYNPGLTTNLSIGGPY